MLRVLPSPGRQERSLLVLHHLRLLNVLLDLLGVARRKLMHRVWHRRRGVSRRAGR